MEGVEGFTDSRVVSGLEDGVPIWNGGANRRASLATASMVSSGDQQAR